MLSVFHPPSSLMARRSTASIARREVALPLSFKPPGVYRPLVWGGLWGIPLAFILRRLKGRHKTAGFIYFLAPVAVLGLIFMPLDGMGLLGLKGGPGIMVHALIANAPY